MSSFALSLFQASNLDIVPYQESLFVRDEARAIVQEPLSFLPPSTDDVSIVSSLKSTARSRAPKSGAKKQSAARPTIGSLGPKKAPNKGGLSKRAAVMPPSSSSLLSSPAMKDHSYTISGVRKTRWRIR